MRVTIRHWKDDGSSFGGEWGTQGVHHRQARREVERGGYHVPKVNPVNALDERMVYRYACYPSNTAGIVIANTTRLSILVPVVGDITSQEDLKGMASRIQNDVGYINVLIANAGMTGPMLEELKPRHTLSDFVQHAWKTPMAEFTNVYGLNCTALYYTVLVFLELLDEGNKSRYQGGKSQVIATASTASFLRHPRAGYAYLSSKAAVISLIKCFSTFCVPWGIRFNAIAAGCPFTFPSLFVASRLKTQRVMGLANMITSLVFPSDIAEPLFKQFVIDPTKSITEEGVFSRSYQPAERAGSIEDMAGLTLYMTSRAGSFVNGSVMLADGGKLATMPATY